MGAFEAVLTFLSSGRVAEWQTRTVQVRVSERTWGFNSPLAHGEEGKSPCGRPGSPSDLTDPAIVVSQAPQGGRHWTKLGLPGE